MEINIGDKFYSFLEVNEAIEKFFGRIKWSKSGHRLKSSDKELRKRFEYLDVNFKCTYFGLPDERVMSSSKSNCPVHIPFKYKGDHFIVDLAVTPHNDHTPIMTTPQRSKGSSWLNKQKDGNFRSGVYENNEVQNEEGNYENDSLDELSFKGNHHALDKNGIISEESEIASHLIRLVNDLSNFHTITTRQLINIYLGKSDYKIRERGQNNNPLFSKGNSVKVEIAQKIIPQLTEMQLFEKRHMTCTLSNGYKLDYDYIVCTKDALDVLK